MTPPAQGEAGYALVTAVVAMALLALIAATMTSASRGLVAGAAAEIEQARLQAAAEAGTMLAINGLANPDPLRRWSIDGRPRDLRFDGIDLRIRVEDERGKIPLNQITEEQVRTMFEGVGLDGAALDIAVDSFLDWRDDDDDVRANGAEAGYYATLGRLPRNGALRSIDELVLIRGVSAAVAARLQPVSTVYTNERDAFDDRYASPLALAALNGGADTPAVIQRQRELAGQRPAIELGADESLVGRPLDIRVEARDGEARTSRATVIELTGNEARPYLVRQYD